MRLRCCLCGQSPTGGIRFMAGNVLLAFCPAHSEAESKPAVDMLRDQGMPPIWEQVETPASMKGHKAYRRRFPILRNGGRSS